ncbi:MAG: phage major capsid protein [Methyloligellaceae bacterium]
MKLSDRLLALNKQRDEKSKRLLELRALADERDLEEAEITEVEKLASDTKELDAQAEKLKSQEQAFGRAKKVQDDLDRFEAPPHPQPSASVTGGRPVWEDDPKKGFKTPREFLLAVYENSRRPGAAVEDQRMKFLAAAGSDEHGEFDDSYGGFLVPAGFSPDLLKVQAETDFIAPLTRKIPMSVPTVNIPARGDKTHTTSVTGGLVVSRKAETAAAAAKRMQFELVTLQAHTLFGFSYATEEILTDSPQSFAAVLADSFGEEFSATLLDERINGTGVGGMKGVLKSGALISVTRNTSSDIKAADVYQIRSQVWGYANPDMLLGRPLIFTEFAASLGTVGDLICVNWREYLEGTLQPLQSAESIHVRFMNHERAFKFWLRNAGLPWWRSALTPKKSSTTMSPYVTIAT